MTSLGLGLLARRERQAPQPHRQGIQGIPGSSTDRPVLPPTPPPDTPPSDAEEEEDEGSDEEEEEEWEDNGQQHPLAGTLARGDWAPDIYIYTRRKERQQPGLPELGTYGINANKLWNNAVHRGNLASHCGLHASIWPRMLKLKSLSNILYKLCGFLWHEHQEAADGNRRDLHIDIFCTHGAHHSVALSAMLQHLLGKIEHHNVKVEHLDMDTWPCQGCKECTDSQVDLAAEYKEMEDLWAAVQTWL